MRPEIQKFLIPNPENISINIPGELRCVILSVTLGFT